jgi:hypothetical protein
MEARREASKRVDKNVAKRSLGRREILQEKGSGQQCQYTKVKEAVTSKKGVGFSHKSIVVTFKPAVSEGRLDNSQYR